MKKIMLLLVSLNCSAMTPSSSNSLDNIISATIPGYSSIPNLETTSSNEVILMLKQQAPDLSAAVIEKVATTLDCAIKFHLDRSNILTIIDYSLPSNQKRLWVFDTLNKKLLFQTYVSHGITSGTLQTLFFSNVNNSKASSLGVFKTEKPYFGRDGLSLRLEGLDSGFNNNAFNRYIVMHGGWYVNEDFIKKYGRAGRSWGCPAIPLNVTQPIINSIKNKSLFVVYYPNNSWLVKSKYLNCNKLTVANPSFSDTAQAPIIEARENIVFIDSNKNNKLEENEPILTITADKYQQFFQRKAPLERMLRRQINNVEYIALSDVELKKLNENAINLEAIAFIIPQIKMQRGYYATEMHPVNLPKIKNISANSTTLPTSYTINFYNKNSASLKYTNQFIRWLGL